MSVVPPPPGVSAAQIDAAEAMVAAELGLTSLEATTITKSGVTRTGIVPLSGAVGVTSVTVNGQAVTAPSFDTTALYLAASAGPYGLASYGPLPVAYTVTYTVGWDDADEMPAPVRQAVLLTAQALVRDAGTGAFSRLRIDGEMEVAYRAPDTLNGLPASAASLLGPFRPLRF